MTTTQIMSVTVTHTNDDVDRTTTTFTDVACVRAALQADAVKVYFDDGRSMVVLHDATIVNAEINEEFESNADRDQAVVDAMRAGVVSI